MKEAITLYPEIHLGQTDRPICFTTQAKPLKRGQYQIWEYRLPGDESENGCFFIIPPNAETNAALITDPQTAIHLEITFGNGYYVHHRHLFDAVDAQRPNYDVDVHPLKRGQKMEFRRGDMYRLIANDQGLVVQDRTSPPFRPKVTEVKILPGDPRAPHDFWFPFGTPPGP